MRVLIVGIIATSFAFTEVSQAGTLLTKDEKEGLTGVYSFKGPFKEFQVEVILEFYQDDANNLKAGGKARISDWPEGEWTAEEFHSFRRLSASEWEQGWGVTEMAGQRCDSDRVCIVAVNERSSDDDRMSVFRLMQFTQDFGTFQSYTVPRKGEPGYLGVVLTRLVDEQETHAEDSTAGSTGNTSIQPSLEVVHLQMELAFWQSVERHGGLSMFNAYLAKYPDGVFSAIAKLKIQQLGKS
ncbi:MAG TPA: hypothetical protein DHW07_03095 [Gammaproteobacteria bacterium]|nr:hypothetical protein [Gammaproteobacteria bacterium]